MVTTLAHPDALGGADATPAQASLWGSAPLAAGPVTAAWQVLDNDSAILHQPHWLWGADEAFDSVYASTLWKSMQRPMYDRVVDVPRLIATVRRGELVPGSALTKIVHQVEGLLGVEADHVGLNLYRDGQDSVAWHRDRIGRQRDWSAIALVSLGGPRVLSVRPFCGAGSEPAASRRFRTRHFPQESGDLVVVAGACQRDWEHAVLKTAAAAPRISIAVRTRQFPHGPLFEHPEVPPLAGIRKLEWRRGRSGGLQ